MACGVADDIEAVDAVFDKDETVCLDASKCEDSPDCFITVLEVFEDGEITKLSQPQVRSVRVPDPGTAIEASSPKFAPEEDSSRMSTAFPQDGSLRDAGVISQDGWSSASVEPHMTSCKSMSQKPSTSMCQKQSRGNQESLKLAAVIRGCATVGAGGAVGTLDAESSGDFGITRSLPPEINQLLSFHDGEELLRGTSVNTVLRWGAAIFSRSAGSQSTYEMSQRVNTIDSFISHNWALPRWLKYFVLAVHYNLSLAMITTVASMAVVCIVIAFDAAPLFPFQSTLYPRTVLARCTYVPVLLATLFFSRDLPQRWFLRKSVFLDKVCIHQTDVQLKKQSIAKLGAFLCHSDEMLVIFGKDYLRKLWTVYEVACFLSLHPMERMVVMMPLSALTLVASLVITFCNDVSGLVLQLMFDIYYFEYLVIVAEGITFVGLCRYFARRKAEMLKTVSTFTVHQSCCFDEADRPVVYENICSFMRHTQPELDATTPDGRCLEVFDELVRAKLPDAFLRSMGHSIMSYTHVMICSSAMYLPRFVDVCAGIHGGMPLRHVAEFGAWLVVVTGAILPVCISMFSYVGQSRLDLHGWASVAWCFGIGILGLLVSFVVGIAPAEVLYQWSLVSDLGLAASWLNAVVSCIFTVLYYKGKLRCCRCRNKNNEAVEIRISDP